MEGKKKNVTVGNRWFVFLRRISSILSKLSSFTGFAYFVDGFLNT